MCTVCKKVNRDVVNKAGLSDCACGCWCLMGGFVADLLYFPT